MTEELSPFMQGYDMAMKHIIEVLNLDSMTPKKAIEEAKIRMTDVTKAEE